MNIHHLKLLLAITCLHLILITGSASVPSRESLGIAPQDAGYYKPNAIKCKDGSKKFTKQQLNDEFCDCPDGTDEPGTSACPEGKFYCWNVGHIPLTIFSSRVNDGICDCCDGSDEYDGNLSCPNTCWEAGKVAREKLKKKIATFQDGVTVRKKEVEKAKQAFVKDDAELSKLKSEEKLLKELVEKLKEHKERIEKAEEERRKMEEEKKLKEEEKKATKQENANKDSLGEKDGGDPKLSESLHQDVSKVSDEEEKDANHLHSVETEISDDHKFGELEQDYDSIFRLGSEAGAIARPSSNGQGTSKSLLPEEHADVSTHKDKTGDEPEGNGASEVHEEEKDLDDSDNNEGLSREELGRLVASRWTGENSAQQTIEVERALEEEKHEGDQDAESSKDEFDRGYESEPEEDKYKYDDATEDVSDDEYVEDQAPADVSYDSDEDHKAEISDLTLSSQSWLEKIQRKVQNILQAFKIFKSPVDLSEAARVRKEYDEASSKLSKMQSRISKLTEKLKHDFGKEKEFYSFYDQCFEVKQNKYTYKVCPFKQASQVEGYSTTQLGRWDKFEDSYRVMLFSHGDKCWNGPDRSLKVRLRCGLKNELTDVDEPSRCEYVALLSTPAVCVEEKLKELQQKLEQMNSGQQLNHDEL